MIIKKKYTLIVPAFQRPCVWNVKKIKDIISHKENKYLGGITLYGKNDELTIIDGQQRITIFLMMYKIANGFSEEAILTNPYHENKYGSAMKVIFGCRYSTNYIRDFLSQNKEMQKKNQLYDEFEYLDEINYKKAFTSILNYNDDSYIEKLLKRIYISYAIIKVDLKINKYDVFIDLNNKATPLAESDIIKSLFLKHWDEEKAPIDLNTKWQNMLVKIHSTKNENMDAILLLFLFGKGKRMGKKKLLSYYENKIINHRKSSEMSVKVFIEKEVKQLQEFVELFLPIKTHIDFKDGFPSNSSIALNGISLFFINKLFYKPLIPRLLKIIGYKNKDRSLKKNLKKIIKIAYYVSKNKYNKTHSESHFLMPWNVAKEAVNHINESHLSDYLVNIFNNNSYDNNKNKEKVVDKMVDEILNSFHKIEYGKSMRFVFDWIISENSSFNNFKKIITAEHVVQTIKHNKKVISKKNQGQCFMVPLEKSISDKMNKAIQDENKTWNKIDKKDAIKKIFEIKKEYYGKSNIEYTRQFKMSEKIGDIKKNYREFYTEFIRQFIKEAINE